MEKSLKPVLKIIGIVLCCALAVSLLYYGLKAFLNVVYPLKYEKQVTIYSEKYDIDPALIYSVIKTESSFDNEAVSSVGAVGLMQMIPETFEWLNEHMTGDYAPEECDFSELINPETSIDYGCSYLRYLLDKYEYKSTAVAAYNAGPGNVDQWLKDINYSKDGKTLESIPYTETSEYVKKVMNTENMYNKLYFDD